MILITGDKTLSSNYSRPTVRLRTAVNLKNTTIRVIKGLKQMNKCNQSYSHPVNSKHNLSTTRAR